MKIIFRLHENNLVVTFNETVLSNPDLYVHEMLINKCKAEETGRELMRRRLSQAKGGYQHVRTVGTDVLILLLIYSYLLVI